MIYNFDELLKNHTLYEETVNELHDTILMNYSKRKMLSMIKIGDENFEASLGYILLNLFLIRPFIGSGLTLTRNELFNSPTVTQKALEDHFNKILEKFEAAGFNDFDAVRETIHETLNKLSDVSGEYNKLAGNSISYTDLVKLAVNDPEANALFHPEIKEGQYSEIEAQFKDEGKKLTKYFEEHPETELFPFISSETGINGKQFVQFAGFIGLKPDVTGNVIPVTVQDNFLNGLKNLESYYINCKGTRLALITNNRMVRRSGYLTRKLSLANIDHYHDNSIEDCGTKHFVIYNVDNLRKLRQIIGRHYYDIDDSGNKLSDELHTVTKQSTDLVGKKIGLRSPVTCCGKHVCATCYGKQLSEVNKDVNTGLVAVYKLTEPLTQRLLSAKHLLTTKTDEVNWGEDFKDYFDVNMDSIYFSSTNEFSISFKKPTAATYDEDEEMYYIEEFEIQSPNIKKSIVYNSPVKLFINPKVLTVEQMKSDEPNIEVNSKSLNEDELIFKYQPKNNELTRSLQQVLDLIESNDHLGITNYSDFVNKFDDLLIENDMDSINSVHIEMISAVLIKDAETHKRPDFSQDVLKPYVINRVSKSVLEGPLAISLAFERINDQLVDLDTYNKDEVSMLDYLFI